MYIGTKLINAEAMTRGAYNIFRGWEMPADERAEEEGYLVEYLDGGKPNLPSHAGYVTWTPKEAFDKAYRPVTAMTFGLAIEALKRGQKVARAGWNGKGMWLAIQAGSTITPEQARGGAAKGRADEGATEITILPHIDMRAADGSVVVGWLASQTDMLAEDWQIVD
jgi:hypothetical protein